jgi:plastocyanin
MGIGDARLNVRKCTVEDTKTKVDCLYGEVRKYEKTIETKDEMGAFIKYSTVDSSESYIVCAKKRIGENFYRQCASKSAGNPEFGSPWVDDKGKKTSLELFRENANNRTIKSEMKYCRMPGGDEMKPLEGDVTCGEDSMYLKLESVQPFGKVIYSAVQYDSKMGKTKKSFSEYSGSYDIYERTVAGAMKNLVSLENGSVFVPDEMQASDGDIIDFNNSARNKATLIGGGIGGAMGGFAAYQGAKDEIDQRWISEVQAYKDSLQKWYCITGKRFLGGYNDPVFIKKTE